MNLHTAIGYVQTSPEEGPPSTPRKLGMPRMEVLKADIRFPGKRLWTHIVSRLTV